PDATLRVWDTESGACRATLVDEDMIDGALALSDERVLSWSFSGPMRIWDIRGGTCLKVLEGHRGRIRGALKLNDGRLLSWSSDKTIRLWDTNSGACVEVLPGSQVSKRHPRLCHARTASQNPAKVVDDFYIISSDRAVQIHHIALSV